MIYPAAMKKITLIPLCLFGLWMTLTAQSLLLLPDRVFDGQDIHEGWAVMVENGRILAAGPPAQLPQRPAIDTFRLQGTTLLPGLIEGHAHILLHPYNETSWNNQVLAESEAERVTRATVHVRKTIEAGFTTVRDLGSEGAGYADVGLRAAINKGIVPGPRLLVAGPAIVATGSYGPKGFGPQMNVPQGAEEADGHDNIIQTVRRQIGKGADIIKVYADYRWGAKNQAAPTFLEEEIRLMVEVANSSGRAVVAHASTAEGMRRAVMAGVATIEHGDEGTPEIFDLMRQHGVALCPTLAAGDAISEYMGWNRDTEPEPERIRLKRASFLMALEAGVTICAGGDVGVFAHGDNARELELMVDYGMAPLAVLRSATSVNARVFGLDAELGHIRPGYLADLVAVRGRPDQQISDIRQVALVLKAGVVVVKP